jgi:ABC-type bacteriocin/lantibiotic exporter with double-glycine peptidase domain
MKEYNLKPQEKNNYCVCSVLQTIFEYHGLTMTQEQIASELTPSENGFYTDDLMIREFMEKNRFKYDFFSHNMAPFNEPDMLLREMNLNHGIIGINSHCFLLVNFKDPNLKFMNPENGETLTRDLHSLLSDMKKSSGWFGLIKHIQ